MTQKQEKIIDKIDMLIDMLMQSDKKDKAKGELENLRSALRYVRETINRS